MSVGYILKFEFWANLLDFGQLGTDKKVGSQKDSICRLHELICGAAGEVSLSLLWCDATE